MPERRCQAARTSDRGMITLAASMAVRAPAMKMPMASRPTPAALARELIGREINNTAVARLSTPTVNGVPRNPEGRNSAASSAAGTKVRPRPNSSIMKAELNTMVPITNKPTVSRQLCGIAYIKTPIKSVVR